MSYLKLPDGVPDFSKAVFSLWFRVPRESVIAASDHSLPTELGENFPMMQNVLPLITFGRPQQNKNYQYIYSEDITTGDPFNYAIQGANVGYESMGDYSVDPCWISLKCYPDGMFRVAFNIQMENYGSYGSLLWFVTNLAYEEGAAGKADIPGSGYIGIGTGGFKSTIIEGTASIQDVQPEYFRVESAIKFAPDEWHHLLLSFDLSGSLALGEHPVSSCNLWYAIDDQDYRGWENMGPFREEHDGLGENVIVTENIYFQSGNPGHPDGLFVNNYVPAPSGSYTPGPIPSNGAELGLPAASIYVNGIFRVEMAEFQMWTGVTLNTGSESNRRAFIDNEGKPVKPTGTGAPAQALLGKKPEIMLHGSSDWQAGSNTGTLGVTTGGAEIATGQFTPVARIEKYKPEPALGA